jgi:hypothetical protein
MTFGPNAPLNGGSCVRNVDCKCRVVTVLALAGALLGCGQKPTGPQRGIVHGKVTLDGKPIADGQISLVPSTPGAGSAWTTVITDGHYASGANGPVAGKSRVEIRASRNPKGSPDGAGGDWKSNYVEGIPARYNTQSTLAVDVRSGDNTFDFELKSR